MFLAGLLGLTFSGPVAHAADNSGEAGFVFLKLGTSARAEGLGGAYSAIADDAAALTYNPAGMTQIHTRSVTATYHNWVADIQSGYVALVLPWGIGRGVGIQLQYLDYGTFDGRDNSGEQTGDFTSSDLAFALSTAWRASDQVHLGITGKFIAESIGENDATGLAADVGLIIALPDGSTRLALVGRNLGSQLSGHTEFNKDNLPATVAAGVSHKLRGTPLMFAADIIKPSDDDVGVAVGLEYRGFHRVQLRGGYSTLNSDARNIGSSGGDLAGLTGGIGVSAGRARVDYAFGFLADLGSQHRVTISTSL